MSKLKTLWKQDNYILVALEVS